MGAIKKGVRKAKKMKGKVTGHAIGGKAVPKYG